MAIWETFKNQDQWRAYLQNLVMTNDRALLRAVVLIYDNQTNEEKVWNKSIDWNGIGFNRWDSSEMSEIAKKIKRKEELKQNEIIHARYVMPKYWKQLMKISKRNMEIKKRFDEAYNNLYKVLCEREKALKEQETKECVSKGKACDYGICSECPVA